MSSLDLVPYIFGALTLAGVLYFLYSIFFSGDHGLGDAGVDPVQDGAEFGCTLIAAFLAAFGAGGLLGVLSGWDLGLTLAFALIFGFIVGRAILAILRYVVRQQGTSVTHDDQLIGAAARITIETPAGATGEALVEGDYVGKYPAREVNGAALGRGDHVDIVDVRSGILYVKKKRG